MSKYDEFSKLPAVLQREAIREGELRLQAQLTIANNADQRALNWARLHMATATAALGVALAFASRPSPDYPVAVIALAFGGLMASAGMIAFKTTRPEKFHIPGNLPSQWIPEPGDTSQPIPDQIKKARREQARHISDQIKHNSTLAERKRVDMENSFEWTKVALTLACLALLVVFGGRWISYEHRNDPSISKIHNDRKSAHSVASDGSH